MVWVWVWVWVWALVWARARARARARNRVGVRATRLLRYLELEIERCLREGSRAGARVRIRVGGEPYP